MSDVFTGYRYLYRGQLGGDREAQRGRALGLAHQRARADGLGPDQGPRAREAAALDLAGRAARSYRWCLNAATVRRRLRSIRCTRAGRWRASSLTWTVPRARPSGSRWGRPGTAIPAAPAI